MRLAWKCLSGEPSCDLANSRDRGRLETSPGSFHRTGRLGVPGNRGKGGRRRRCGRTAQLSVNTCRKA